MDAVRKVSYAIEDMKQGSNLFDDVDATVVGFRFTKDAPSDTYAVEGNPIFGVFTFLLPGDGPEDERKASQSYSLGASAGDSFTISEDGRTLIPTNDDSALRLDSKFGSIVASIQNSGVAKNLMQEKEIADFVGMVGHFKRIADKERNFNDKKQDTRKSKFPPSTLLCTKVISLPWDKAGAATGAKTAAPAATGGKTATATPAAALSAEDVDSQALAYLEKAIKNSKDGSIQRANIILAVTRAADKDPNKNVFSRRAADEAFLTQLAEAGLILFDVSGKGQPVSLPAAA